MFPAQHGHCRPRRSRPPWSSPRTRFFHVDAIAFHDDALLDEEIALALALRDASVGMHDALPRNALVGCGEDEAYEPRGLVIDPAVALDLALWDAPDGRDDRGHAFGV